MLQYRLGLKTQNDSANNLTNASAAIFYLGRYSHARKPPQLTTRQSSPGTLNRVKSKGVAERINEAEP